MDSAVLAAYIAAGASLVTLAGTMISQRNSSRATSQDNEKTLTQQRDQSEKTLTQQRDQLNQTLAEQRHELDKTLAGQSKQLDRTLGEQRTRTLNERFATAAGQLGSDKPPAVQLAGVYAMAGLADDWPENRQTCVDVLCAYLRLPYEPDPGDDASVEKRLDFQASREVRHTVIRVICTHLRPDARVSWQGLNLDFTGTVFDGGSFEYAHFSDGMVDFNHAEFSSGTVSFNYAVFSGSRVDFNHAVFSNGTVSFRRSHFCGPVNFSDARFSGGEVNFTTAEFEDGQVNINRAEFCGSQVNFTSARFSGTNVFISGAKFSGGTVDFNSAEFSGGTVDFNSAEFRGSKINFNNAEFSGGTVDFTMPKIWMFPPTFPWTGMPPSGVKLPSSELPNP